MVMKKAIIAIAIGITLVSSIYCENITSIYQCMNTNLTPETLACFPTNQPCTIEDCVLFFVRGCLSGELSVFATPFSEEIRSSEFGFSDIGDIPVDIQNEFYELMTSISNCTNQVTSYGETTNNVVVKANITIFRQGANYCREEVSHLVMAQANNIWQIVDWDADQ